MKKMITLSGKSLIFVVFLLSVILLPTSVRAAPQIEIVSHTSYLDFIGYYNVVGEVHNTGDQAAKDVLITATLYNSGNEVIATPISYTRLDVLLPDRKSPFRIVFVDIAQSALVDHYSLDVDFTPTDSIPEKLEIISHNSTSGSGMLIIAGEIENTGDLEATLVEVIATGYDEAGNVVEEDRSYLTPTHVLGAHQKATFQIGMMGVNVDLINSYELTAESDIYALIPEFNSYLSIILTVAVVSIALLIHRRARAF